MVKTKPTVHLNGTSREGLLAGYCDAAQAIRDALTALWEAAPNGRDHYLQGPEAYGQAAEEHQARVDKLQEVIQDLEELAQHVSEAGR